MPLWPAPMPKWTPTRTGQPPALHPSGAGRRKSCPVLRRPFPNRRDLRRGQAPPGGRKIGRFLSILHLPPRGLKISFHQGQAIGSSRRTCRRAQERLADPNVGRDAIYIADGGAPVLVRVVARRADAITDFGDARLWSETTRIDLRVAEVPSPRPGEWVEIDGDAFLIHGEPVRDRERLVWTVDLRPA